MLLKEARAITGGLSFPSKMPGTSYGIPAQACKVGAKLALIPGSVCCKCYALRGNYQWPAVKNAQARRLEAINHPQWVDAMVTELTHAA
jgi:hypothetical protein